MSSLRLAALLASSSFLIACLTYLILSSSDEYGLMSSSHSPFHSPLRAFFSFSAPASLFAPAATISLTDDNSTFFAARSAAFGPALPDIGLSGQLWIGSGFHAGNSDRQDFTTSAEGELGCGDLPDWHEQNALHEMENISGKVALLSRGACGFADKVRWAQRRNASAVIVGDNVPGEPLVRMWAKDTSNITIPSVFTSHTSAHLLSALVPQLVDGGAGPQMPSGGLSSRTVAQEPSRASVPGSGDLASLLPGGTLHSSPTPSMPQYHEGLWVTLTVSSMAISPLFNTLFVLVVSPLLTLGVVYAMLFCRSRIRRRRWRAPKSVVDQLPVRIYHTSSSRPSPAVSATREATAVSPLLGSVSDNDNDLQEARDTSSVAESRTVQYGTTDATGSRAEKTAISTTSRPRRYEARQVECAVCLEEYEDGVSKVMSLPCGHDFHADCITPWLVTKRRTCPICKGDVVRSVGDLDDPEAPQTPQYSQSAPAATGSLSGRISPVLASPLMRVPALSPAVANRSNQHDDSSETRT